MNERKAWVWLAVATIVLLGGILLADRPKPTSSAETDNETATILALRADDWRLGRLDAPVTLVEYGDFQCPACANYAPMIDGLMATFPNDLTIIFRHFPLIQHDEAQLAARSAEAAGFQGQFWQMADLLYVRQAEWAGKPEASAAFDQFAFEIGLDLHRFKQDQSSVAVTDHINAQLTDIRTLGLTSTPSFFLNGRLIDNPPTLDAFRSLIQTELDKQNTPNE